MARSVTTLSPWFGSNRTLAHRVGEELKGCSWVGVPFAGGMCELAHIDAPSLVVSDLHRNVINLASVAADSELGPKLYRCLKRQAFHPECLDGARAVASTFEPHANDTKEQSLAKAICYFVSAWMNRSAKAGTDGEFSGGLPVRWNSNGGDSNTRYRSAVTALVTWRRVLARCNFVVMDCFDFLDKVKDDIGNGVYCDPPFVGPGDDYKHKFTLENHIQLARRLEQLQHCRVVCRFYDCEFIRFTYLESHWNWKILKGRDQANQEKPEVLLVRNSTP